MQQMKNISLPALLLNFIFFMSTSKKSIVLLIVFVTDKLFY